MRSHRKISNLPGRIRARERSSGHSKSLAVAKLALSGFQAESLEPRQLFSIFTVNSVSDLLFPHPGQLTLRKAVADANANPGADTINFSPTVFAPGSNHTITLVNGELLLKDSSGATTITGPGAAVLTLAGTGSDRIFEIAAGSTVSMSGLTVSKGQAALSANDDSYGGGILNAGSLSLTSVDVSGNLLNALSGGGFGGGIYSSHILNIANCSITGNTVSGYGESNPVSGGGISASGTLTITNSIVSNNNITCGGFAGAPFGPHLPGNKAEGGGIDLAANTTATLTGDTIAGNSAIGGNSYFAGLTGGAAYGGGVYNQATLVIASTSVTGNSVQSGRSQGGDDKFAGGGGIYSGQKLTLEQSTVSGNTATGGASLYPDMIQLGTGGGAAGGSVLGAGVCSVGPLTVLQSTLSGNQGIGGAGNGYGDVAQARAIPGGGSYGGGLFSSNSATVTDSTIANNGSTGGKGAAAGPSAGGGTAGGTGGDAEGGGIEAINAFVLSDSTVSGNTTTAGLGGAGDTYLTKILPPGSAGISTGGGFAAGGATTKLNNSIVSANFAGLANSDILGAVNVSSAYNLIGVGAGGLANGVNGNQVGVTNPMLSALGSYGGPTQTMMPSLLSPALNTGKNSLIPAGVTTDQRGLPRIAGATVDIGAVERSQIVVGGKVFNDTNGDGIQQAGEAGMAKWQVYIDLNDAGVFQHGDPIAMTASDGSYTLTISPITTTRPFIVREAPQPNWRRSSPAGLGYYTLGAASGMARNINFGDSATSLVNGVVYRDINNNGKLDAGEPGLANWTVEVDYQLAGVWHDNAFTTKTNANGDFSFILIHGIYRIHEVTPRGYTPTKPSAAGYGLTLGTGATVSGENFGNR